MSQLTERTTLILGAGASAPYGFPLGIGLRDLMLEYDASFNKIVMDVEYDLDAWDRTRRLFLVSQFNSVDDFLKRHPEEAYVTKLAITYHLNACEILEDHCDPRKKDRWYRNLLFDVMGDDPNLLSGLLT